MRKITEFYKQWFMVCLNITSKFPTTAVFKSFVKQNNDSNRTCAYARDLLLFQSATAPDLPPYNKT
jgi:hypothetical protein